MCLIFFRPPPLLLPPPPPPSSSSSSSSLLRRCPEADDELCPGGLTCFGDTACFYDEDLVPTSMPAPQPTLGPTTESPVAYDNPANFLFCVSGVFIRCRGRVAVANDNSSVPPPPRFLRRAQVHPFYWLILFLDSCVCTTHHLSTHISSVLLCVHFIQGLTWAMAMETCSVETHCPSGSP